MKKNASIYQNFSMHTGFNDYKTVGQLVTWNDLTKLSLYEDKYANLINGSDGSI